VTLYAFLVRYSTFDFLLLFLVISFYACYYVVYNWSDIQGRYRSVKRRVAREMIKEKIKYRLQKHISK